MVLSNYTRYYGSLILCTVLCTTLHFYARYSNRVKINALSSSLLTVKFTNFQNNYLLVFILAMFSDWLQGPYVYELYVSYGFSQAQIAELFVCGFGSSFIVGTFVGGLADKLGRKNMSIMYSVCYISACLTKLVPEYWTLMLGRFLSGVSTSLLFSVFESWMVSEHHKQGYDVSLLGETFASATFYNGVCAVVAGLIANYSAVMFGYVAPFVVAILPLSLVAVIISYTWSENYGNQQLNMFASLSKGFELVTSDSKIAALGISQSCFEGAMYTFVFMWTPALKSNAELSGDSLTFQNDRPTTEFLGTIFAVFMISVMIGSTLFKIFSFRRETMYKIPLVLHGIAVFSMAVTAIFMSNKDVVYAMFLLFEMSVGLFYPAYGVIKSEKIPEEIRSAVMNIFRMPLNVFVVVLLLKIQQLSPTVVFTICAITHFISFGFYYYFYTSSISAAAEGKHAIVYGHGDIETTNI